MSGAKNDEERRGAEAAAVVPVPATTPDGTEPSRADLRKRLMMLVHESYPGLDYLMLELMVDHYLDHPEDTPEDILRAAPPDYFVDNKTEVNVRQRHPDDRSLFEKQPRPELIVLEEEEEEEEEQDARGDLGAEQGGVSGGTSSSECSESTRYDGAEPQ